MVSSISHTSEFIKEKQNLARNNIFLFYLVILFPQVQYFNYIINYYYLFIFIILESIYN